VIFNFESALSKPVIGKTQGLKMRQHSENPKDVLTVPERTFLILDGTGTALGKFNFNKHAGGNIDWQLDRLEPTAQVALTITDLSLWKGVCQVQ
jgi:hypothetical protein